MISGLVFIYIWKFFMIIVEIMYCKKGVWIGKKMKSELVFIYIWNFFLIIVEIV